MKAVAIVPARLASTRLPNKPLQSIGEVPLVVHTLQRCREAGVFSKVMLATDAISIAKVAKAYGFDWVLTKEKHPSGTDRVAEAYQMLGEEYDVVVNVQGDEPFVAQHALEKLLQAFEDDDVTLASLCYPASSDDEVNSSSTAKVVLDAQSNALYFSRLPLPYFREVEQPTAPQEYLIHYGIYGYRPPLLTQLVYLPPARLELAEKLEQLRWLAAGYSVRMVLVASGSPSVDTESDLEIARSYWAEHREACSWSLPLQKGECS